MHGSTWSEKTSVLLLFCMMKDPCVLTSHFLLWSPYHVTLNGIHYLGWSVVAMILCMSECMWKLSKLLLWAISLGFFLDPQAMHTSNCFSPMCFNFQRGHVYTGLIICCYIFKSDTAFYFLLSWMLLSVLSSKLSFIDPRQQYPRYLTSEA